MNLSHCGAPAVYTRVTNLGHYSCFHSDDAYCAAKTLTSWKISHILVPYCKKTAKLIKKSTTHGVKQSIRDRLCHEDCIVTCRKIMPLKLKHQSESQHIAGVTWCHLGRYSVKLTTDLLSAKSFKANFGRGGMRHVNKKSNLFTKLFL